MPQHQQSELLDQSAASLKQRMRHGGKQRDTSTTQDSQASNYAMQQIYSQQYAPGAKGAKVGKGRMGPQINHRVAHSVLDNHPTSILD